MRLRFHTTPLFLLVLCFAGLHAQSVVATLPDTLFLGTLKIGESHTLMLSIQNTTSESAYVYEPSFQDSYEYASVDYKISPTGNQSLAVGSSLDYSFRFTARHNMPLHAWITVRVFSGCREFSKNIVVIGSCEAEAAYSFTNNIEYSVLYDSLHAHVDNHTNLTYKPAREMMFGKADNVNDSVECIYTGKKLYTTGIPPNGEFNTEHSWVQSRGSSTDPNHSDVNHLYPTNPNANSIRANYPFGKVQKVWKDAGGGSRLGFAATGDTVFEPRDVSKGNIARSMFYYLVRYGNVTGYYTSPYNMDADLRAWNSLDPPDNRERARCDTITVYQKKQNPFVYHPEFAERMDFIQTAHSAVLRTSQHQIIFDPAADSASWDWPVVNTGPDTVALSTLLSDIPSVSFDSPDSSLQLLPHSTAMVHLHYRNNGSLPQGIHVIAGSAAHGSAHVDLLACTAVDVPQSTTSTPDVRPQPMDDCSTVRLGSGLIAPQEVALFTMRGQRLSSLQQRVEHVGNEWLVNVSSSDCGSEHIVIVRALMNGRSITRIIVRP